MTKEDQIKNLVDISQISGSPAKELPKEEENKEEEKEEDKEDKEDKEEEKEENKEEQKQTGGLLKRILVTNMSLDKDKEMFQM